MVSLSPENDQNTREVFAQGVIVEWLYEGRIGTYTIPNVRPLTVDEWVRLAEERAALFTEDKLDLSLHDFSQVYPALLTSHARKRASQLARVTARNRGYVAVILPDEWTTQVVRFFVEMRIQGNLRRETRVFAEREAGLEWLVSKIEK